MSQTYDVIVAGAGPVGLFLACELGMAGISVLVLERDASPDSPLKALPLGGRGMNIPSVEAFYRRGLLEEVFDSGDHEVSFEKTLTFRFAGHFAGIMLDANKIDLTRWKYRLIGPSLHPGRTYLARVESLLSKRAESFGVQIQRGAGVSNLTQDDKEVIIEADHQTFRAKYLVGCDGGRSFVRRAAGFEFVGTDAEFTGYSVLCDLDDPEKLKPGFQLTKSGIYIVAGVGQVYVMDFDGALFDRSKALTVEHFQTVLRRVSGTDIVVKAIHVSTTFTDRAKQATTYRKGRVLLAGDSAHIHSPLGAQGLNTGLGDALNLGWKLASVLKGRSEDSLLETYTQERHPIAAWVLEWTRAQVATARPNAYGHAIANVVRDIVATSDGANYFIDRFWGLSQRYDLGDSNPLVGASVPDFEFNDGTRLGLHMIKGRGLLLDLTANPQLAKRAKSCEAVDYMSASVKDSLGLKAMLVRPDGVVAWASEGDPDLAALEAALKRWFGE